MSRLTNKWSRLLLCSLAGLLALSAALFVAFHRSEPVTTASFDKITLGMSEAELQSLLGQPKYDSVEPGLVNGPESYINNSSLTVEQARKRVSRDRPSLCLGRSGCEKTRPPWQHTMGGNDANSGRRNDSAVGTRKRRQR
jgi:hypothetical protein